MPYKKLLFKTSFSSKILNEQSKSSHQSIYIKVFNILCCGGFSGSGGFAKSRDFSERVGYIRGSNSRTYAIEVYLVNLLYKFEI